jgi:hypothetical protein
VDNSRSLMKKQKDARVVLIRFLDAWIAQMDLNSVHVAPMEHSWIHQALVHLAPITIVNVKAAALKHAQNVSKDTGNTGKHRLGMDALVAGGEIWKKLIC